VRRGASERAAFKGDRLTINRLAENPVNVLGKAIVDKRRQEVAIPVTLVERAFECESELVV
jgi:hypothetical protein